MFCSIDIYKIVMRNRIPIYENVSMYHGVTNRVSIYQFGDKIVLIMLAVKGTNCVIPIYCK